MGLSELLLCDFVLSVPGSKVRITSVYCLYHMGTRTREWGIHTTYIYTLRIIHSSNVNASTAGYLFNSARRLFIEATPAERSRLSLLLLLIPRLEYLGVTE